MPWSQLGRNSVLVHVSRGNTKPLHRIKSHANVDGWSVSQTFSTAQESSHHILKLFGMLKLNFNMPIVKPGRHSPAVPEQSKGMALLTTTH